MGLKGFQSDLLEAFEAFLSRARELGDPSLAFAESTRAAFGHATRYHPLPNAESVPYVCLRVPTGGGKTRLAGHAIDRVRRSFLSADFPLVVWLVPSDPIREQTMRALATPGDLLHDDLSSLFGALHVLGIEEALAVKPATLDTAPTIVVATMQSFKREGSEGLRVNRRNGALMDHFVGVPPELRGEGSLVDVIRLRRPFVVVDEAHNLGSQLAVDTLVRLGPACVLELTATPDRERQPSNVLRTVSAATLQGEDMLKLPLELAVHPEWRVALTEAIGRLRSLEHDAAAEEAQSGEVIAPVMLIQAERRNEHAPSFTPDVVKRHLIEDFQVPEAAIAIATGAIDELGGRRPGEPGFPTFVITIDKLREGWDCPDAYVLFSFRSTTSATAVEQVLGRVLRMPNVRRKAHESLNRSYAYVVSDELAATVQGLRDGLVQNGFERLDTRQFVRPLDADATPGDLFVPRDLTVPLPGEGEDVDAPGHDALDALPAALRNRVEFSLEAGTLTLRGDASASDIRRVAETFRPQQVESVRRSLEAALVLRAAAQVRVPTPSERGESVRVPQLALRHGDLFVPFDETALLDADWEVESFDPELTEGEFAHDVEAMRRARLSISELEKVECSIYDKLDHQLALFAVEDDWDATALVAWLDANIQFPYAARDQKVAWIGSVVDWLMRRRDPPLSLGELAYRKYRLRGAVERKLAAGLRRAKQCVFAALLQDESRFGTADAIAVEFRQGRYAYDTPYVGLLPLNGHFFPAIGNLKDRGEEFDCAEHIANRQDGVAWWIRNVERKPSSFWLQTATDRFYPDFVIGTTAGGVVAVEYKGAHIADGDDSREKRRIGELWERRSPRCAFAWVERGRFAEIGEAMRRADRHGAQSL
jgi:type III restriction enzyme